MILSLSKSLLPKYVCYAYIIQILLGNPYAQQGEFTEIDNYLQSKLKMENFTKLLLAENPDNSLTLEELDTLEIPNFSKVTIKNNFVNLAVSFK